MPRTWETDIAENAQELRNHKVLRQACGSGKPNPTGTAVWLPNLAPSARPPDLLDEAWVRCVIWGVALCAFGSALEFCWS